MTLNATRGKQDREKNRGVGSFNIYFSKESKGEKKPIQQHIWTTERNVQLKKEKKKTAEKPLLMALTAFKVGACSYSVCNAVKQ